ncbi:MAG: Glu-tRNA(Gln) amidotransferase subunit GatD, partial [Candidatus Woesearchaeota archaeon]
IADMKLVSSLKEKEIEGSSFVKKNPKLPTISILHTGGTIASKVDYRTGGVTANFSAAEMLQMFPELTKIANIESRQIAKMQSEMIRFVHYNIMADAVEKEVKNGVDGIIITHGTDTMHYSSAALAFILENLPVPVMLVGAQRSSDRGSSDAAVNLINAAYFIANSDFAGVAICMHETMDDNNCLILPATKTRKMHTSRRDAFRPINTNAIARVNYEEGKISFLSSYTKKGSGNLEVRHIDERLKVGIIKTHTNMFASEFLAFKDFDGLVIEGTGLGHIPNEEIDNYTAENKKISEAVAELTKSGVVVVMAPQTIYGRIQMNVYTPQRELQQSGVLGHLSDMTPETTFIKLAWLLSNYKKSELKELIAKNLRGEVSERTEKEAFLI